MNLPLLIAAGVGGGVGLTCVIAALAPARPDLRALLAPAPADPPRPRTPLGRAAQALRVDPDRAAALARLPRHDLELIGRTPATHGLHKLAWTVAAALVPGAVFALLTPVGIAPSPAVTAATVGAAVVVGFALPDIDARVRIRRARTQLRHALRAYLVLVALECRAGVTAQQALVQAARVSQTWMFARLHAAVERAQLQRRPAWEGLRELAPRVGIPELADCAELMAGAADGVTVADTLLTRARGLRDQPLAQRRGRVGVAGGAMAIPVAALGACLVALLSCPLVVRLLAG
ncbi:hypothetical protein [Salinactinospora qingdaonensis]|uniref:Type II secretion system (T2SS), protein F n=1 Tax=Salinactinospora qingdaonensis TaxID=702744 RepID=A0ABP7FC94_9ACTN